MPRAYVVHARESRDMFNVLAARYPRLIKKNKTHARRKRETERERERITQMQINCGDRNNIRILRLISRRPNGCVEARGLMSSVLAYVWIGTQYVCVERKMPAIRMTNRVERRRIVNLHHAPCISNDVGI